MNELSQTEVDSIPTFSGGNPPAQAGALISQGKALGQVKTKYFTAVRCQVKRKPIEQIASALIAEARLAGEHFFYRWPVKNKRGEISGYVEGASRGLAAAFRRYYGNCTIDIDWEERGDQWIFTVYFIDLESGQSEPRIWKQKKPKPMGSMGNDRAEAMAFQAAQSKAIRNAAMQAIPEWVIDACIKEAKKAALRNTGKDLEQSRAGIVKWASGYGVSIEQLEIYFGGPMDGWTAEAVTNMKAQAMAVRDGTISITELFQPQDDAPKKKRETPPPGSATGASEELTADDRRQQQASSARPTDPPAESNWWAWQEKGRYVHWIGFKNIDNFRDRITERGDELKEAPESVQREVVAKWRRLCENKGINEAFPLSEQAKEEPGGEEPTSNQILPISYFLDTDNMQGGLSGTNEAFNLCSICNNNELALEEFHLLVKAVGHKPRTIDDLKAVYNAIQAKLTGAMEP